MALPVTRQDAKDQLRVDSDEQDYEIDGFIADAAAWVEKYTGHIMEARDVTEQFDGFDRVDLRAWPIKPDAVPVVTYQDGTGSAVGVPAVRINVSRRPARVLPWIGSCWPAAGCGAPVTVTVRAGYEAGDPVPRNMRRAMLVLIAAYNGDREGGDLFAQAEKSARGLCGDFRRRRV